MTAKDAWGLVTKTFSEWTNDKCPRMGAALAYYTLFSMAPVLVIAIAIAGWVFGEEAAKGQIVDQIGGLVGQQGAEAIQTMIANARRPGESIIAAVTGLGAMIVGATAVFVELQDSLNTVWDVRLKPDRGIKGLLKDRLTSFGIVVGFGFLLMVSLILSAAIAALGNYLSNIVEASPIVWQGVNLILSLAIFTFVFMMLYRILPDVELTWGDTIRGALVTAVLFTIGKFLIGLYLGNSSIGSEYGAAGSMAVLLVWLYYSAQIVLFGAEFTQVWAEYRGRYILPSPHAVALPGSFCDREHEEQAARDAQKKDDRAKEEGKKRAAESDGATDPEREVKASAGSHEEAERHERNGKG